MNPKIEKLIKMFARLPRVGNRAATRIVLSLLADKTGKANQLAENLTEVSATIHPCAICGVLTDAEQCEFCRDVVLCVLFVICQTFGHLKNLLYLTGDII